MLAHINMFILLFFVGIIVGAVIILLLVTPKAAKDVQKMVARRNKQASGASGDKGISTLMEELSRTRSIQRINELTDKILEEVEKMETFTDNKVQLRKVEIIKKWLDSFSQEQHIIDLKTKGISQQVQFDNDKKDFKLMILKK